MSRASALLCDVPVRWPTLGLLLALALPAGCGPEEATVVPPTACGGRCVTGEVCDVETDTCTCAPGYQDDGAACVLVGSGPRSRDAVCERWREGHVVSSPSAFEAGSGMCGLGAVPGAAIDDALRRIAMYRWLAGLDAVEHDAALGADAQACSVLTAWWDFGRPESPHTPSNTATCWSLEGARGAGASNLAWGIARAAEAVDGFMEDAGENNVDALGHRRWILNPPLGPVGIGFWTGASTRFQSGSCLHVFRTRPGVRGPEWNAVPPAGFAPVEMTRWTWSVQGSLAGLANAQVSVERVNDGARLEVEVRRLVGGAGQPAVSWVPVGWRAEPGNTYRVRLDGVGAEGSLTYEVTPVDCSR